jgi:transcriptional regulator with XRE-family HTH domain
MGKQSKSTQANQISTLTLGERIRSRRQERGLSIAELARRSGITQPFLSEIERGRRNPSDEVLERLAQNLDLTPEALRELNIAAALRDFRGYLEADPELGVAFAGMVRALKSDRFSSKSLAKRFVVRKLAS